MHERRRQVPEILRGQSQYPNHDAGTIHTCRKYQWNTSGSSVSVRYLLGNGEEVGACCLVAQGVGDPSAADAAENSHQVVADHPDPGLDCTARKDCRTAAAVGGAVASGHPATAGHIAAACTVPVRGNKATHKCLNGMVAGTRAIAAVLGGASKAATCSTATMHL